MCSPINSFEPSNELPSISLTLSRINSIKESDGEEFSDQSESPNLSNYEEPNQKPSNYKNSNCIEYYNEVLKRVKTKKTNRMEQKCYSIKKLRKHHICTWARL
eukprot:TRINITY_DN8751_c0_g3_i1.p1 TRINITY_DN8751_c0_g3~~TRINITY_DN8751_c0_g3_i1.p1  ORF type:complete len:103 (+),score=7.59 TRINITY_DN8751_c0_g3_i1:295-603(+)